MNTDEIEHMNITEWSTFSETIDSPRFSINSEEMETHVNLSGGTQSRGFVPNQEFENNVRLHRNSEGLLSFTLKHDENNIRNNITDFFKNEAKFNSEHSQNIQDSSQSFELYRSPVDSSEVEDINHVSSFSNSNTSNTSNTSSDRQGNTVVSMSGGTSLSGTSLSGTSLSGTSLD